MLTLPEEILLNILKFTSYRDQLKFLSVNRQLGALSQDEKFELAVLKQLFKNPGYPFGKFNIILEWLSPNALDIIKFHLVQESNSTSTMISKSELPLIVKLIANNDEKGLIKQFDRDSVSHVNIKKSLEQQVIIHDDFWDEFFTEPGVEIDFNDWSPDNLKLGS